MSTEEFTRLMEEHEAIVAEEKSRDRTDLQEDVLRAAMAWYGAQPGEEPDTDERLWNAIDKLRAAEPAWGEGK